jgi:urocanate hydratase
VAASQSETLRLFTALHLYQRSWAGKLLLGIGLNDTGRSFALASLIAGAALLVLEEDAVALRDATREGCATFTVTSLDEALRALKNEIRQGRAITVALGGSSERWLAEMTERGILPQALASTRDLSETETSSVATLQHWGALRFEGLGLLKTGEVDLAKLVGELEGNWRIINDTAATHTERRERDTSLLDATTADHQVVTPIQQHWLRAVPTLFPRSVTRAYWSISPDVPPSAR